MKNKLLFPVILVSLLVAGTVGVSAISIKTREKVSSEAVDMEIVEELKQKISSEKYEIAEMEVEAAELIRPHRYLMWTYDGKHIMWGRFANGYFIGTDNQGKRAWGIYHKGIFVGFYDGEFFYGKYWNGRWMAINLFGENISRGRFVLFPTLREVTTVPVPLK